MVIFLEIVCANVFFFCIRSFLAQTITLLYSRT